MSYAQTQDQQPKSKRRRRKQRGQNQGAGGAIAQTFALTTQPTAQATGGQQTAQPAVAKGPPPKRQVTILPAFPKTIEFGKTLAFDPSYASATGAGGELRLELLNGALAVGQSGPNVKIIAPGDGKSWLDGEATATVTVTPVPRVVTVLPAFPKTIEFGKPFEFDPSYASATGAGGDLRLELPKGPLAVGQTGPNVKIVAPGDGKNWLDGDASATVTVTPAPRSINSAPPAKPVMINTPLTVEMFTAAPSIGDGAVVISEPAGKKIVTYPKQRVVLTLAPAGNYAAAPPVTHDIDVDLPERQFEWNPPAELTYLTPLTPASLGVAENDAVMTPLATSPPGVGTVDVTITLPGDNATCKAGVKTRAIKITPAARHPVIATKTPVIRLDETLTAATFGATASIGPVAPIVTSPVGPLTQLAKSLSVTISFAPDPNFTDTPESFNVVVAKGKPVLTWTATPNAVVKGTKVPATLLNATIAPPNLSAADIEYDPPGGTVLAKSGLQLITATYPGNASYLPAGPAMIRMTVCDTESAAKGANAMKSDPDEIWRNKPNSPKFGEWDANNSALKAEASDVMNQIKAMDMTGMRQYLNGLPNVTRRNQPGSFPEEIWKTQLGVQVRLKPHGSENSNGKAEFMVEVLKDPTRISSTPGDIAFKVTVDCKPSPKTPGEVMIAEGDDTVAGGTKRTSQEGYASGAMMENHLRPLDSPPPRLIEWDMPKISNYVRATELFQTVPRAIADAEVKYFVSSQRGKEMKYGDTCVILMAGVDISVEARATGYKTEKRVLKVVSRQ